jgi:hypothetical protein
MWKADRTVAATVMAGLLAVSMTYGAYLESGQSEDSGRDESVPVRRHIPRNPTSLLLQDVVVGRPITYGGLTIFALARNNAPSTDGIRTLDEALKKGWIEIREKDSANVNELQVRNRSGHSVLLMGGEIISGGKQNRAVKFDVLLRPRSGLVAIPVYCIEKDRWDDKHTKFSSPSALIHGSLRKSAISGEAQDSIWREVDAHSRRLGVDSETRNYEAIYQDKSLNKKIAEYRSRFRGICGRRTVGIAVTAGGQVRAVDLFSDPELLDALWDKLLQSYIVEHIGGPTPGKRRSDSPVAARNVRRFLDQAARARFDSAKNPGAGQYFTASGSATGSTLTSGSAVVHAVLFSGVLSIQPIMIPEPYHERRHRE